MAKGWSREFDDPIDLPDGRKLVTLEDAGNYITKLPKAGMAGGDGSSDDRRDAWRADDVRQDRCHEGVKSASRPRVQSPTAKHALGKAETEAGPMTSVCYFLPVSAAAKRVRSAGTPTTVLGSPKTRWTSSARYAPLVA
jgi:hypothetical protein